MRNIIYQIFRLLLTILFGGIGLFVVIEIHCDHKKENNIDKKGSTLQNVDVPVAPGDVDSQTQSQGQSAVQSQQQSPTQQQSQSQQREPVSPITKERDSNRSLQELITQ